MGLQNLIVQIVQIIIDHDLVKINSTANIQHDGRKGYAKMFVLITNSEETWTRILRCYKK